nr:MAG TPA: hypothetical protein [Caudoviricetes sp.]
MLNFINVRKLFIIVYGINAYISSALYAYWSLYLT